MHAGIEPPRSQFVPGRVQGAAGIFPINPHPRAVAGSRAECVQSRLDHFARQPQPVLPSLGRHPARAGVDLEAMRADTLFEPSCAGCVGGIGWCGRVVCS